MKEYTVTFSYNYGLPDEYVYEVSTSFGLDFAIQEAKELLIGEMFSISVKEDVDD